MNVVIVEDEAISARRMERLLVDIGLTVVHTIHANEELSRFLSVDNKVDMFFMDIHLSDGIVFEVLDTHNVDTPIIFTTAYDQYAIKAFKQNSIDYLLKPINKAELEAAIAKHKKAHQAPLDISALKALLVSPASQNYKERLSIKIGDKIKTFKIGEVLYFHSENKINYMVHENGRSYPIDYTIVQLSKLLDPKEFYRVNRGCIMSINAIQDVIAYSNSRLKIVVEGHEGQAIIVSRDRVKDFKEWLG